MKFDIARQPLVPAFLTLLAVALVAICGMGHPVDVNTGTAQTIVSLPGADTAPAAEGLALLPPGDAIHLFQTYHPLWSKIATLFLVLFTGMSLARMSIRYNFYTVNTCLVIPLYGILLCGVALDNDYLATVTTATLMGLSLKNFGRSFSNGYAFDALFRAAIYLSLLVLVAPAALPMLLLLPMALILFRRTVREAVVALAGALFPLAALCYINWGLGGSLTAPLANVVCTALDGVPLSLYRTLPLEALIALGVTGLIALVAYGYFQRNLYALGTKARFIMIFNCCTLLLAIVLTAGPAATRGTVALLIPSTALLLPLFFIRINRNLALLLYLLLLIGGISSSILQ